MHGQPLSYNLQLLYTQAIPLYLPYTKSSCATEKLL